MRSHPSTRILIHERGDKNGENYRRSYREIDTV